MVIKCCEFSRQGWWMGMERGEEGWEIEAAGQTDERKRGFRLSVMGLAREACKCLPLNLVYSIL